ncbi:hypothetical protein FHG87_010144 [Trinorchestia longiramus]|nr:hypothetical protein FHG87_010144 [Trinorchestia longiramus]
MDPTDTLGAAALGVLALVFVGALVALSLICYRRQSFRSSSSVQIFNSAFCRPEVMFIDDSAPPALGTPGCSGLELEDVKLAPQIKKILNDAQWVDDATGLVPHSLAILKLCHHLTERLVASAHLEPLPQYQILRIIEASRKVSSRVDDVARAMYSPLDPRLLEARCSALTLTLALLTAHTHLHFTHTDPHTTHTNPHIAPAPSNQPSLLQRDIADDLAEMERHVQILREAADCYESFCEGEQESSTPHRK